MKRRQFLGATSFLAVLASLGASQLFAQQSDKVADPKEKSPQVPRGEFKPLRRNVGTFSSRGGTIGWFSSSEALVAIDTQFPDTAAQFLAGLPGRAGRTLDVVVNTHHHGDHTGGNPVFLHQSAEIVAHRRVPFYQMRAAERAGNLDKQAFAKTLIEESWTRSLGDETLTLRHHGPAHTGGDITAYFEKANVLHVGDLVFNRIYPVMDRPGGTDVKNWIQVLEKLIRDTPRDVLLIHGHGRAGFGVTGLHEDLGVMRDYLSALYVHVEKSVAAGKTRDEVAVMDNFPGFEDFHVPPGKNNRLPSNLAAVYDELTAPKRS